MGSFGLEVVCVLELATVATVLNLLVSPLVGWMVPLMITKPSNKKHGRKWRGICSTSRVVTPNRNGEQDIIHGCAVNELAGSHLFLPNAGLPLGALDHWQHRGP